MTVVVGSNLSLYNSPHLRETVGRTGNETQKKEDRVGNWSNLISADNLLLIIQIHKCSLACSLSLPETGTTINASHCFIVITHKSWIPKWLRHPKLCQIHEVKHIKQAKKTRVSDNKDELQILPPPVFNKKLGCGNTHTSIKASARENMCLHLSTRSEILTYGSVRLSRQLPPWHFFRQFMPTFGEQLHVNFKPRTPDG